MRLLLPDSLSLTHMCTLANTHAHPHARAYMPTQDKDAAVLAFVSALGVDATLVAMSDKEQDESLFVYPVPVPVRVPAPALAPRDSEEGADGEAAEQPEASEDPEASPMQAEETDEAAATASGAEPEALSELPDISVWPDMQYSDACDEPDLFGAVAAQVRTHNVGADVFEKLSRDQLRSLSSKLDVRVFKG